MPKYSIITCISNAEVYDRCLLQSIKEQRREHDIEIIPVINNDNRYSASLALNLGIDVAKSQYLICAHQDVRLLGGWFDTLDALIADVPEDLGILGAAGIAITADHRDIGRWGGTNSDKTIAVGSVWDTNESLADEPYWNGIKALTKVHCVDECLFVFNRNTGLRFDTTFNGFHLYGADICLQARAAGYAVYAAGLPIIHYGKYSTSITSNKYWAYLRLLFSKWRYTFPEVLGTHMHWSDSNAECQLTSYIPMTLESDVGGAVEVKAMGLGMVHLTDDAKFEIR